MIVPSMSSGELYNEVLKDYQIVVRKAMHLTSGCRRDALKSKDKFVLRQYDYKSKLKNDWLITVYYYVKRPTFSVVVYYLDEHGLNSIMVSSDGKTLFHYYPHYLTRYNERFLKQNEISKKDILKRYLKENPTGIIRVVPDIKGMKNCFFSRYREGIGLGYTEHIPNNFRMIHHFKTFIANDMITDSQEESFDGTGRELELYWNEMYSQTNRGAFD